VLRGDKLLPAAEAAEIVRALPHGHVLAALGTARRIALDAVLPRRAPQRRRDLVPRVWPRPKCRKDSPAAALRLPRRASPPHWPFHLGQAYRVRSRLAAGGRWIRTIGPWRQAVGPVIENGELLQVTCRQAIPQYDAAEMLGSALS
jgi:hypothetical protein